MTNANANDDKRWRSTNAKEDLRLRRLMLSLTMTNANND
jgi:hypothetical protein